MSFVSRLLLGTPRSVADLDLRVDLERLTVGDVTAGDTRGDIERRLGPSRSLASRRKGRLDYGHLGLQVRIAADRLVGFDVYVTQEEHDPWRAYRGQWLPWRREEPPDEAELIALWGQPSERDDDEDGPSLFWQRRALINADFSPGDGRLAALWIDFDEEL